MILRNLEDLLLKRKLDEFLPMKVEQIIKGNNLGNLFKEKLLAVYDRAFGYLRSWTEQYEEYDIFQWMTFDDMPTWSNAKKCINYFDDNKLMKLDEAKFFEQFQNFKDFVQIKSTDEDFKQLILCDKWVSYFKGKNEGTYSELLKMASFYFALPAHNANCERIFSFMNIQWTDERNRIEVDTIKAILQVQFNLKSAEKCYLQRIL